MREREREGGGEREEGRGKGRREEEGMDHCEHLKIALPGSMCWPFQQKPEIHAFVWRLSVQFSKRHGTNHGESKSIVQQTMQKTTDIPRRIVPVEGRCGVALSYACPHCHRYMCEDCIWWVSTGAW